MIAQSQALARPSLPQPQQPPLPAPSPRSGLAQLVAGADRGDYLLVFADEAHFTGPRDHGPWLRPGAPGPATRVSFYGLYLHNHRQVRLWPYTPADAQQTVQMLGRLRSAFPGPRIVLVWDAEPHHRGRAVVQTAAELDILLIGLAPELAQQAPLGALWDWLNADIPWGDREPSPPALFGRVERFEARANADGPALASRLGWP